MPTEINPEKPLIPAGTPRVQRSELVQSGEIFTLNSWDTADGLTRILMPMDTTDEEFQAGVDALRESDEQLESLRKITSYVDSFEDDEETIARCLQDPGDRKIRVTYRERNGGWAQADIHQETGEGRHIHTRVAVVCRWDSENQEWRQVDPWDWRWNKKGDAWERVANSTKIPE